MIRKPPMPPHQSPLPFDDTVPRAEAALHGWLQLAAKAEALSYDELRDGEGQARPAWKNFLGWLENETDAAELDRRCAEIVQQIRDDGVTHNVYTKDTPTTAARPWSLELLPLLIEPADWTRIESGIVQRASLLNAMLVDLYGEQRLLHEGLLPAALVFHNPGYLRPLQGVKPPQGLHLHIVAFDIARDPDGAWWVVSQRTQNPSGLGYVMHNRLIVSRLFPDAFREMRVQHLASSYRRLLDTVDAQASKLAGGGSARVALLTPGPFTETYFEHAYLARYLGVPLVEGGDLTVRDDHLYLKTVQGLEPVHALLRRLDDDFCDPLELRGDSTLGVPGLVQAVRAGNVVMANALGSAFLESPAVQGFLPAISRRLLKQELTMPSLPTWWCGERAAWRGVRSELEEMVVRPTYQRGRGVAEGLSSPAERESWSARIDDHPEAFTVQGRVTLSQAPLWHDGRIQPRPSMLRVYAIADIEGRWHVLPGGMTRVAGGLASSVSMQHGGSSLDTWVMTDGPVDVFSMLPRRLEVDDLAKRRRPVSSRTAENLFWLGRYTERTEQLVRLARATLSLIDADADAPPAVQEALSVLALHHGLAPYGSPSLTRAPHLFERALLSALGNVDTATSLGYNLKSLARTSGALRERLSPEQTRLIRTLSDEFIRAIKSPEDATVPTVTQVLRALDHLAVQLAAVTGAQTDRMTRDHGWRLLTTGRLIERLLGVAQQFRVMVEGQALATPAGNDLLLELADSTITFRARYQRHQELLALVELLVLDDSNPRSWSGVLRRLRTELRKLPGDVTSIEALLALLPVSGAGMTLDELRNITEVALRERLVQLSTRLVAAGWRLSEEIGLRYFAHAGDADRVVAS